MKKAPVKNTAFRKLGLDAGATTQQIRQAFRVLAKKYHPDRNNHTSQSAEKFKDLSIAYREAMTAHKEMTRQKLEKNAAAAGFSFSGLFRPGADKCFHPLATHGKKVEADVPLTFEEAIRGVSVELKIQALMPCPKCFGQGSEKPDDFFGCPKCQGSGSILEGDGSFLSRAVCPKCLGEGRVLKKCGGCGGEGRSEGEKRFMAHIPAGVDDGNTITIPGEGHAGAMGGRPGDLHINVRVGESKMFLRKGNDIFHETQAPFTMAVFGGKIVVPTLDGDVLVTIPPGLRANTLLRLNGRGVNGKGSQFLRLALEVPTQLTAKEKKILEDFARTKGYPIPEQPSLGGWDRLGRLFRRG
ncbi:MAG: J domain-containing protein [Nitrospinota bacterium]|nr:J domain-containing protein [Nitrospinota bacterium]